MNFQQIEQTRRQYELEHYPRSGRFRAYCCGCISGEKNSLIVCFCWAVRMEQCILSKDDTHPPWLCRASVFILQFWLSWIKVVCICTRKSPWFVMMSLLVFSILLLYRRSGIGGIWHNQPVVWYCHSLQYGDISNQDECYGKYTYIQHQLHSVQPLTSMYTADAGCGRIWRDRQVQENGVCHHGKCTRRVDCHFGNLYSVHHRQAIVQRLVYWIISQLCQGCLCRIPSQFHIDNIDKPKLYTNKHHGCLQLRETVPRWGKMVFAVHGCYVCGLCKCPANAIHLIRH